MTSRYPGGLIRKNAANTSITGASGVWDLGSQAQAVKNNTWPISGLALPVSGSLRFRKSASAYLNKTLTTPTNNLKWTWSCWFKRGEFGSGDGYFFINAGGAAGGAAGEDYLSFIASTGSAMDSIVFAQSNASTTYLLTTPKYRDPSAWYHLVFVYDSANATSSNRALLYINGVQVTAFSSSTYPTSSLASKINSAVLHRIGCRTYAVDGLFDGYMAEINFIDGQALTPASFGQTSAITGVWEPIKYTGTYGTNGFYLSLSDTSSIGKDFSGNGNNWTPNNISTTSGATFDLMRDVPTQWAPQSATDVGGVVRGNYATFNPITGGSSTCSDGNLAAVFAPVNGARVSSIAVNSGKWYAEFVATSIAGYAVLGIGAPYLKGWNTSQESNANAVVKYSHASGGGPVGSWTMPTNSLSFTYTTGDVMGLALDMTTNTLTFYKNGSNVGNFTFTTGGSDVCFLMGNSDGSSNGAGYANFGQRPFAYTPPSGFKSLCTTNLPTPTIGATAETAANKYFNTVLYTGNQTARDIDVGFASNFVWIKDRSAGNSHALYDIIRGATKSLRSDTTNTEATDAESLTAFTNNGFSLGDNDPVVNDSVNRTSNAYVAWNWNAGGSTVTNTSGTISSQVRANPTAGFSIVTWTGSGSTATIGHGLGVTPKMIIWMHRTNAGAYNHGVYHASLPSAAYALQLTLTLAQSSDNNWWNSTAPTSSVFTVGGYNISDTMVAYCFSEVPGYSAFGSYTGNGSTDGSFIFTGFRPRWILIKVSSGGTGSWILYDTARNTYNVSQNILYPNLSNAEATTSSANLDILSNGFKLRTSNADFNGSGFTYIYAAFAEFPFKNSLAR